MAELFPYLLNASICSAVFYLFYYCILRKLTFFKANRIFLIGSLLASLIIPILDLKFFLLPEVTNQPVIKELTLNSYITDDFSNGQVFHKQFSLFQFVPFVYIAGSAFMLVRFCLYIYKIVHLVCTSQITRIGRSSFVLLKKGSMPFSFFHFIFIDKMKMHDPSSLPIIKHELVHARELHSLDLTVAMLISVLLWFNPFVFFYRNSIKENHEYLADSKVILSGINPLDYLTTLAKEVFRNHLIGLTSNFNYSITKKRLLMITRINSPKRAWLRFLLVLPLLAILIVSFTKPIQNKSKLVTEIKPLNKIYQIANIPCIMPVDEKYVTLISGWGWRIHPIYKIKKFHEGMDFKAPEGSPVYATASGIAELVKENKNSKGKYIAEGKYIKLRHSANFQTKYTHLSEFAIKQGDQVNCGQVIGYVGNTGFSTGTHLHYEVIKDGKNVDPKNYFK